LLQLFHPNVFGKVSAEGNFLTPMLNDDRSQWQTLMANCCAAFADAKAQELCARRRIVDPTNNERRAFFDLA
jgi:hypothetical protein